VKIELDHVHLCRVSSLYTEMLWPCSTIGELHVKIVPCDTCHFYRPASVEGYGHKVSLLEIWVQCDTGGTPKVSLLSVLLLTAVCLHQMISDATAAGAKVAAPNSASDVPLACAPFA